MKIETKKKLYLVSAILSFISIAVIVFTISVTFFSLDMVFTFALEQLELYTGYDLSYYLNLGLAKLVFKIVYSVMLSINFLLLVFASTHFYKMSRADGEVLLQKKTKSVVWAIISLLFLNFLSGVIALIATFSATENITDVNKTKQPVEQKQKVEIENKEIIEKIADLKKLKESGAISNEEYEKLLTEIIK